MNELDKVGEKFNLEKFLNARESCISTIETIIDQISEEMTEQSIKQLIEDEFQKIGVTKYWHPTKIRIGSDTTKTFRALSDPTLKTKNDEICFLDLGPIINDHEADFGRTFLIGSNKKNKIIDACYTVFAETSKKWREQGLSGIELFHFAEKLTKELGFEINPMMSGHRLGDFPHKLYAVSDGLFELDRKPTENLWILEIHIIDPKNNIGAFFEDLLIL